MPGRPPVHAATIAALAVAIVAVSSSAPLIVFAAAPALGIAFWRNAAATVLLAPVAATRRRAELRHLATRAGRPLLVSCVLAGVFLAAHFGTWVPSAKLTHVADSVALGATQPVWQGLIARAQGRHPSRTAWIGIGVAVAGAIAATGADIAVSGRAVAGDLLALAGGVAMAVYTAFGERARVGLSTISYTTICYGVCALVLGAVCLVGRVPLHGYPASAWLAIAGIVAGAQLLGHSMFSYALRRTAATTVAVLILLEVPGSALIAWLWLGQTPTPGSWPGLALLPIGVAIVVLGSRRSANGAGGPTRDAGPAGDAAATGATPAREAAPDAERIEPVG